MQQSSTMTEEVAVTIDKVDIAATGTRQVTVEGREINSETREAAESVVTMDDKLVDRVTELGGCMNDIEATVEVTSKVVEQTNLLTLNANIEAIRASEDGDGPAAVTEEVKSLADETRQHTEDIATQIENIQSQTDEAVHVAMESNGHIEHTDERISEMLAAFEEIAASIDTAANGAAEVFCAADEQAEVIEELIATVEDIRDRAVETEGAVGSTVAAADESTWALSSSATEVEGLTGSRSA